MRLRWGLSAGVSWIVVAAVGAGCSSAPPAVQFGTAEPSGSKLGVSAAAGDYLPAAQWPDACSLLTDQELRSVLPQTSEVARKQQSLDLHTIGAHGHTDHIPSAGCRITFRLPAKNSGTNSDIVLMIRDIGDSSLMKKQLQDSIAVRTGATAIGAAWGADACYSEQFSSGGLNPTADCVAGQYYFDVRVSSSADYFERDGAHDNSGVQELHDKVLSQVVRILAAAMR